MLNQMSMPAGTVAATITAQPSVLTVYALILVDDYVMQHVLHYSITRKMVPIMGRAIS